MLALLPPPVSALQTAAVPGLRPPSRSSHDPPVSLPSNRGRVWTPQLCHPLCRPGGTPLRAGEGVSPETEAFGREQRGRAGDAELTARLLPTTAAAAPALHRWLQLDQPQIQSHAREKEASVFHGITPNFAWSRQHVAHCPLPCLRPRAELRWPDAAKGREGGRGARYTTELRSPFRPSDPLEH